MGAHARRARARQCYDSRRRRPFPNWFCDLDTGRLAPRLLGAEIETPIWSSDGQRVAFRWLKEGQVSLAVLRADGMAPPQD